MSTIIASPQCGLDGRNLPFRTSLSDLRATVRTVREESTYSVFPAFPVDSRIATPSVCGLTLYYPFSPLRHSHLSRLIVQT